MEVMFQHNTSETAPVPQPNALLTLSTCVSHHQLVQELFALYPKEPESLSSPHQTDGEELLKVTSQLNSWATVVQDQYQGHQAVESLLNN
jgi:hypothetical protein